jgi:hypothetical protein
MLYWSKKVLDECSMGAYNCFMGAKQGTRRKESIMNKFGKKATRKATEGTKVKAMAKADIGLLIDQDILFYVLTDYLADCKRNGGDEKIEEGAKLAKTILDTMREAAGKDIACLLEGWRNNEDEEEGEDEDEPDLDSVRRDALWEALSYFTNAMDDGEEDDDWEEVEDEDGDGEAARFKRRAANLEKVLEEVENYRQEHGEWVCTLPRFVDASTVAYTFMPGQEAAGYVQEYDLDTGAERHRGLGAGCFWTDWEGSD